MTINLNDPPAGGKTTTALYVSGAATFGEGTTVTLTSGEISVGGALTMTDNAQIVPSASTNVGVILAGSLSMTSTNKIDLGSGALVIGYTGASPLSTIRGYILRGYNGGNWLGNGITSSAAAATKGTALGYGDTGSQIIIGYTWLGDTNLDGVVNGADLANISPAGTTWATGDFNYDEVVNADDFALFQLGAAESHGANISTVLPEPVAIAVLAPTFALCRRRRR